MNRTWLSWGCSRAMLVGALTISLGCSSSRDDDEGFGPGGGIGGDDGGTGGDEGGSGDDGGDGGSNKFDVEGGTGGDGGNGDGDNERCKKVDFLFVIDKSGSMEDEQQNLTNSFPGFIAAIRDVVKIDDFQILVTDTGATSAGGMGSSCINSICTCSPSPSCCMNLCGNGSATECNGVPCGQPIPPPPSGCDADLGAGRILDQSGQDCGIVMPDRYMVMGQPSLDTVFACVGQMGTNGDNDEKPMAAMMEAVGPLNAPGQCNEGFVRDDAILVVTIITDEGDDPNDGGVDTDANSPGDPATWRQALIDAKLGLEENIVVLGLLGDPDIPGGVCPPLTDFAGADPAPRLREFAESFSRGQWSSVCASDYAPFFEAAISVIESACDDFVPPG